MRTHHPVIAVITLSLLCSHAQASNQVLLETIRITLGGAQATKGIAEPAITLELEVPTGWEVRPAPAPTPTGTGTGTGTTATTLVIKDPQSQLSLVLGPLPPPKGMGSVEKAKWSGIMAQALEQVILPAFKKAGYEAQGGKPVPIDQEGSGAWVTLQKTDNAPTTPTLQIYSLLEKNKPQNPNHDPRGIFAIAEIPNLPESKNASTKPQGQSQASPRPEILAKIVSSLRFVP